MLANDRDRLSRGDVVSGNPILFIRGAVEIFFNDLLSAGEAVASAHWKIMADRLRLGLFTESAR